VRDAAYAVRSYRRSPVLAAVIILSSALGIGANTALFSVVDAAYLRKLPVPNPDRLVGLRWRSMNWRPELGVRGAARTTLNSMSSAVFPRRAFEAFLEGATVLDVFAFANRVGASVDVDGQLDSTTVQGVSGNYFAALGVPVVPGRPLTDADDLEGAEPLAVVSHDAWQRRFGGDPDVVGQRILLNGHPFTIVGVVTPEFRGTDGEGLSEFLVPLAFETEATGANITFDTWALKIMGRLKPGFTLEQVRGNLEGAFREAAGATARTRPAGDALRLEAVSSSRGEPSYRSGLDSVGQVVWLLGAVFVVLLMVVCMTISNLLTARAGSRRYEIGVRLAMGAGRIRLIRQLLTESLLLALAGGGVGAALAYFGKDLLGATIGGDLDLRIDPVVLAFALTASIATGLLFGLMPAVQSTRRDVYGSVQAPGRSRGHSRSRLTAAVLIAQVVLSVVILSGAGVLVQTLGRLPDTDGGIDASNLTVFRVNIAPLEGDTARYGAMLDAIRAVPGVVGITSENAILVGRGGSNISGGSFRPLDGIQDPSRPWGGRVRLHRVGEDYFDVLGLPVTAGRRFGPGDGPGAPPVAIITEGLAQGLGGNPLGRMIRYGDRSPFEIVGVVEDIGVGDIGRDGTIFMPASQRSGGFLNATFEMRTVGNRAAIVSAIRTAVAAIDPRLPVSYVTTATQLIEAQVAPVRRMALTWTLFGLLALALTSIGLYGLLTYSVTRRTAEIGIRMALGARRVHIVRSVVGRMMLLVLFGLALGLGVSWIVDAFLRAFVYGANVYDPASVGVVAMVLLGVTGLAGYVPARRASRMDPTAALRCE
ncbi:MAG: ADOP family duplicated permease, partial [Planctomycetota bacterium]|nr:ADOP family duplicated permease [Planctomycetota bacterium]